MSDVFYTSDLHIGHNLVAGKRGFQAVEEDLYDVNVDDQLIRRDAQSFRVSDPYTHDSWLAKRWDAQVKTGDQVWVLGDISINGGQAALDWIAARPGVKHLIAGNHDPVHPQFRSTYAKKLPHWLNYFETISPFARRKIEGISFLLSHYPYASYGDGPERGGAEASRDNQYRLPEMGMPLLHGHTHGKEREHGSMFHVGVDAWDGQLVPQSVIQDWLVSNFKKDAA